MSHHLNNEINLHGRTMPFSQPYYISVEIRYRNNRLRKVGYRWCDNYARGILRCHLARGGTSFFIWKKESVPFLDIAMLI